MKFEGGCLCGSVHYTGANPQGGGLCHCIDCRKSSGAGYCAHMIVAESDLEVTGDVTFFDAPADSGNVVSRGFCANCGSPVFSRNSGMPGMTFVRASSLDDPEIFEPKMIVYTKHAISWNKTDPSLPAFEGMPAQPDMPDMHA